MGPRETALNALIACRKDGAWSNGVLKSYIQRDKLDSRDAALATRLCGGVLQNRYKMDFYLSQLLKGRVKDLHPAVRDILHMGIYQLYEMDKIPESAAVNEAVALAKKYCKKYTGAPGLVNAVLRNAAHSRGSIKQPTGWQEIYSHPQELIDRLLPYVGKQRMERMLKANNEAPNTVIQVNTLKITAEGLIARLKTEGVAARHHSWMGHCLLLDSTGNLERLPSFQDGLFYVQDPAARLSVLCAEIPKHACVLDCCAAPGGKSFAAAIAMAGTGSVISCDVYEHKARLIAGGARRLGFANITALQQDATAFVPQWENAMDCVIADVPCSGYGIIRKKPDIRYKKLSEAAKLPNLQRQILENQARYVKKGGTLLYSTCTLLYEENEAVVERFLKDHTDFYMEPLKLPEQFPENKTGTLLLVPGQYDTDGFFIAKLRRKV